MRWATDGEGRICFLSQAAAELLGVPAAEVLGRPLSSFPVGSALGALLARDREVWRSGRKLQGEERLGPGDGRRHLVVRFPLATGAGRYVAGIALDLDDGPGGAAANPELGEATFRQILDAIADMVLVKGPQSRLLWANRAFLDVYGMTNQELQGLIDAPFVEPDFTQQYVKDDYQVFSTGKTLHIPEEPVTSHDGHILVCQTVKSAIFDDKGQVAMTVGVSRDISDRKRMEAQMLAAKDAAEAATRAKSEFLATMSHEIRTPLNGVLGMIELLMATELNEEQRNYATAVQACGRALLGLIGNVLDLSKIEAGGLRLQRVPFEPRTLIEECRLVVAEEAAAKGLSLAIVHGPGIPAAVLGDRERLRQVLLNLLSNAVKFTESGRVTATLAARPAAAAEPSDADPDSSARGAGDSAVTVRRIQLEITVEDTGIGMSRESLGALFRPFFQADGSPTRRYGGTGLGLAISKRIIDQMGGSIEVRSALGEGTRFSLVLPCFEAPPASAPAPLRRGEAASRAQAPAASAAPHPLSILVAEDNSFNQMVIIKQLSLLGHTADVASNGVEALAATRNRNYDLVLMDCQMPEMDGFEVTRLILAAARATGAAPPVIVAITANAMEGDAALCLAAGMNEYLSKPISLDDLRRVLRRWS